MKLLKASLILFLLGAGCLVALAQGPLTNALNLRTRTDAAGYLMTTGAAYTSPDGPLTALANLRLRTDANGYVLTTTGGGIGRPSGVLYWQNVSVANAADTNYISSTAYSLPAGTVTTDGDRLKVEADFKLSADTNSRNYQCNIGYSSWTAAGGFTGGDLFISNATTTPSVGIHATGFLVRTSATVVSHSAQNILHTGAVQGSNYAAVAITWANANNILCACNSAASIAAACTLQEVRVTFEPR